MAARRGPVVEVDERTDQMSLEALMCRRYGGRHAWMPVLRSARRRAELLDRGQTESVSRCVRECGARVTELIDLRTGDLISRKIEYPSEGYLIAGPSRGRLPVSAARQALYMRKATMM
jgi:hypothetical protein